MAALRHRRNQRSSLTQAAAVHRASLGAAPIPTPTRKRARWGPRGSTACPPSPRLRRGLAVARSKFGERRRRKSGLPAMVLTMTSSPWITRRTAKNRFSNQLDRTSAANRGRAVFPRRRTWSAAPATPSRSFLHKRQRLNGEPDDLTTRRLGQRRPTWKAL